MTDLLGIMESWAADVTEIRGEDGALTAIRHADIVSGKPVPPRPSPRMRVSAEQACLLSNASWPAMHTEPLGEWLLRASGGFSARANSVMATGDPGMPFDRALGRVREFYDEHGLPAWAQVLVGSPTADAFTLHGWVTARPGEADSEFQIASVSRAVRAVRPRLPGSAPSVTVGTTASSAWLAHDERALRHREAALAVLQGPADVAFVSVGSVGSVGSPLVAKGRISCDGDWAGITDVWVSPDHRRRGLGFVVMAAMLDWAAERGATTAYLQVRGDNQPGLRLYDTLGFRTHHSYRYLAAPDS
jgi:GNAT superfamily N-acetyltransferase